MMTILLMTVFLAASEPDSTEFVEPQPSATESRPTREGPEWDANEQVAAYEILFDDPESPEMFRLRIQYELKRVVAGAADEYDQLRRLSKWTHDRWKHDGSQKPTKSDPLTILSEAQAGKRFRCVEYAIVLASAARSLGMPARVLGLMRADVETARSSAGHVVVEVWLSQFKKWVFVDPQMDVIAEKNGRPLTAVEFKQAISAYDPALTIRSSSKVRKITYLPWISPYLYYFNFNLDQRQFPPNEETKRPNAVPVAGKIMLVPKGAKKPTVFQRNSRIGDCTYVSNPDAFFRPPR